MIAKNIKAKSFSGCVKYVMKSDAEVLKAEGVMALSAESMVTSFELQRSVRSEIKSPVGHIPISFAPEDRERMTNTFMLQLAEEYMKNMGIRDTQYIVVRHHDADNEHVHIVYNRIDNSGKLITDKNDYKRNIATCKRIKDKYGLTYGKNKLRVKREKLRGSERAKHDIYHANITEIVQSRSIEELEKRLKPYGIGIQFKYRRGTDEVQGISFTKDNYTFKGSQIDTMHSYSHLQIMLKVVDTELTKREQQQSKRQPKHNFNHRIPTVLGGVNLAEQQRIDLDSGKVVYLEGLIDKKGVNYNAYAKWSKKDDKLEYYKYDPYLKQQLTPSQEQDSAQEREPNSDREQEHQQSGSLVSGGLGLFDLPINGGDDPEEDAFRNRMQRPKKKGIRR